LTRVPASAFLKRLADAGIIVRGRDEKKKLKYGRESLSSCPDKINHTVVKIKKSKAVVVYQFDGSFQRRDAEVAEKTQR
jgi:hypothetical protein